MKKMMLFFALLFAMPPVTWAECKAECREAYESAVESCQSSFTDPAGLEDLQACMESAEEAYGDCMDDCGGPGQAV
ncbi:MAG: hypothetical protein ABFD97_14290 [Syntrophobacter sp.]